MTVAVFDKSNTEMSNLGQYTAQFLYLIPTTISRAVWIISLYQYQVLYIGKLFTNLSLLIIQARAWPVFLCIQLGQYTDWIYQGGDMPRSLHILRASISDISECLGTVDTLLVSGFINIVWFPPSRKNLHPFFLRWDSRTRLFIRRPPSVLLLEHPCQHYPAVW